MHYSCADGIEKSFHCDHRLPSRGLSLVMPISDPRDRFFYPTLTLMIILMDAYNLVQQKNYDNGKSFKFDPSICVMDHPYLKIKILIFTYIIYGRIRLDCAEPINFSISA